MCKRLFFLVSFILILGLINGTAQAELRASLEVEPARDIDLTAEGTADWAYWWFDSLEPANQKAGATDIGELTLIGNVGIGDTWGTNLDVIFTDGENPVSGTVDDVGNRVWIYHQDKYTLPPTVDEGYELVVTAGTVTRTLKLYICNKHCNAKIVATLGDESIETIVDTGDTPDIKVNYAYKLEFSHPTEHELYVRYFYSPDARYYDSVRMGAATLSGPLVQIQTKATEPRPGDEQEDVTRDVVLSWRAGVYTAPVDGHKIYFSENFNDVKDGIGGITQSATSYAPPQRLDFNTTYYWRVDEVTPDLTVYEGRVLSFTTELFTYPVENITATASSSHQADMGPENSINGSGLDANDLHSNEGTDMWLSSIEPLEAWIQYEFDKVHKLHQMWVWNSNQTVEPLVGFGAKDVVIEYSTNGTDYTTLGTTVEFARAPGTAGYAHNTTIDFGGVPAKYVRLTANSNWGSLMPQYGLGEVRFFCIPVHARNPYPDSEATDVDVDVVLDWAAGREAVTHDVHFGDSMQAVIDSTTPVISVAETSYGPLALDLDTTYYWRVDEVNEAQTPTTWQGGLWSFTAQDHFVVDDFESYNDLDTADPESNRIFLAWLDGYEVPTNGCLVGYDRPPFAERTIVHSGKQAMPVFYSNTGSAAYSEAERTFAVAQNWTQAGAATLVLYFHGTSGNTGQLYVKINGSKVTYDGEAANLTRSWWHLWNIDLASIGTNLQNVTTLSIGIDGNGASGTLYVDDFGLYALAPAPPAPPAPVNEWRIAASSDDAELHVLAGGIDLSSSDLELGNEGAMSPGSLQTIGCRWVALPIPKGATITEAWVQFSADSVSSDFHIPDVSLIIEGELSPSPATFSSTAGDISSRPRTTAQVVWDIPQWMTVHAKGPEERTADISSIVQEIVNQDGWNGNAIVLIFRDNPAKPSQGTREAESFNGSPFEAPLLHINYQ